MMFPCPEIQNGQRSEWGTVVGDLLVSLFVSGLSAGAPLSGFCVGVGSVVTRASASGARVIAAGGLPGAAADTVCPQATGARMASTDVRRTRTINAPQPAARSQDYILYCTQYMLYSC